MELYGTKPPGTGLAFAEILAFSTLYDLHLQPWEVALLSRIDRVALTAEAKRKPRDPSAPHLIPATDSRGVRGLLKGMAKRTKDARPADKPAPNGGTA